MFFVVLTFFPNNNNNIQSIKTKLITNVHKDLPLNFDSEQKNVILKPGEIKTINKTFSPQFKLPKDDLPN